MFQIINLHKMILFKINIVLINIEICVYFEKKGYAIFQGRLLIAPVPVHCRLLLLQRGFFQKYMKYSFDASKLDNEQRCCVTIKQFGL